MCALGDTDYCLDPHFSMSDEEKKRMRAAVRKFDTRLPGRNWATEGYSAVSARARREYMYWHRRDVESMRLLGALDSGR